MQKIIKTSTFVVNPHDNGGEQIIITTKFYDNTNISQEITMGSFSNSVTFNLAGAVLTPEVLRDLADQLAKDRNFVQNELMTS